MKHELVNISENQPTLKEGAFLFSLLREHVDFRFYQSGRVCAIDIKANV